MTIKIELTIDTLSPTEAGALAAFLLTLHPDAVTAALGSLGGVTVSAEPAPFAGFGIRPEDAARLKEISSRPGIAPSSRTFRTDEDGAVIETVMPAEAGAPSPDVEPTRKIGMPPEMAAPYSATLTPEQAFGSDIYAEVAQSARGADAVLLPEQAFGLSGPASVGVVLSNAPVMVDIDLDAEGLPWDERIHSSNHKQSANGVWMKRRGVLPTIDAQVRAELRQTYPAPAPSLTAAQRTMQAAVSEGLIPSPPVSPAVPVPPPPAVATPAPPAVSAPNAPSPSPAAVSVPPAPTVTPEAPGSSPAPSANGPAEFQRIMQKLAGPTGYQPTGKVTLEQTNGIVATMGLTGLADLLKNPDRIPEFEAQIDALAGAA